MFVDYTNCYSRQEELDVLKHDLETLKFDFIEAKKHHKKEIEKIYAEKKDFKETIEKKKSEHIKTVEEECRKNIERMKQELDQKIETIERLQQDNMLYKTQLTMLEQNLTENQHVRRDEE